MIDRKDASCSIAQIKSLLVHLALVFFFIQPAAGKAQVAVAGAPDPSFLDNCAFVCIDIQESTRTYMKEEGMPSGWRKRGFTLEDCNAAIDFLHDVAMPNARRVADICRGADLPMVFVHWGYRFKDAMDLDPQTRQTFVKDIGPDPSRWPHHISARDSRPAAILGVRDGEYVIAKSAQDAFPSSNIEYVLRNLEVENIIFVGGHTQGCLNGTAKSAKRLGFKTLCIEDATFNARESSRNEGIEDIGFDYVLSTEEFLKWMDEIPQKVSKPFEYSGYTQPEYESFEVSSEYVEMSDGVKVAVDIYLPSNGPNRESFPVLMQYTPYQRSRINPETGEIHDESDMAAFFTSYGYVMVCVDMRGTGASTGWLMDFMPQIADDGKQVVDWIAEQTWCDGNVGMFGGSYLGWSQTATGSRNPEALKCIMPSVIPLEGYTGEVYPGGIFLQGFLNLWSEHMYFTQRNYYDAEKGRFPSKPVVDEDGDGDLSDEIPLDVDGSGTFLDDGSPPKYSDNEERQHIYYTATVEHHEKNHDYAKWAAEQFWIDAPSPLGYTIYELGPNGHVPGLIESEIPIYHVGGWFDGFARGSFELYCTLEKTNRSKLILLPGYHSLAGGPFWELLGCKKEEVVQGLLQEHLRYFDYWLKGVENGINTEDPICLYVMNGGGWKSEREWPLEREVRTKYFLAEGGRMFQEKSSPGTDRYRADFSHSSSYGSNNGNRWLGIGGLAPDTLPLRTEKDKQCLYYDSPPLNQDTEVTGHPVVNLWVSSTADYGDFFVYLEDVGENGEAILVTEGQLRAGFAGLQDNDEIILSGETNIEVLPELPWHGFEEDQYVDRIFADGKRVMLEIDFHPTSWVFKKGRRIRLSVACADYPTFRLHPKLCPTNDPADPNNTVPEITIHRGEESGSFLDLPVIPGEE